MLVPVGQGFIEFLFFAPTFMESSLIRILPACLSEPLPPGWDNLPEQYAVEVMPEVERPEVVTMALQTTEPDILILDADFPDVDIFEIVRQSLEARPGLAVLLVSNDSSSERMRQAMLSGAEDYLVRPLDAEGLRRNILAATGERNLRVVHAEGTPTAQVTKGIVIGVMSGKGGLGKTTIATNMAAMIAKATKQPIGLIGLESGDGAVLLSLQPRVGLLDMAGAMGSEQAEYSPEFLRQFGVPHRNGLMYWTWQGTATAVGIEIPHDFLPNLFEVCRHTCAYTFVDLPLLNEEEATGVAPLLDIILVVSSTSDLLALRSTKVFLEILPEEVRPRIRVVVNRADEDDMISSDDFESGLNHRISAILPNDRLQAAQAINMGAPFITTLNQTELSHQMQLLGEKLFHVQIATEAPRAKKKFSLF